jgi:hypothetical protein
MLTALIALTLAVLALALLLLSVVAAGIRHEPPAAELSTRAPSPVAAVARRVLGLYVYRPRPIVPGDDRRPDGCLSGRPSGGIRDEGW